MVCPSDPLTILILYWCIAFKYIFLNQVPGYRSRTGSVMPYVEPGVRVILGGQGLASDGHSQPLLELDYLCIYNSLLKVPGY